MSLAILAARAGDRATELDAIAHATSGPIDPFVELNAAILLEAAGDFTGAAAATQRLLEAQPDIEQVLANGPPMLPAPEVRAGAARSRLAAGDPDSAFTIALTADARPLTDELLATIGSADQTAAADFATVVAAWFGDQGARAAADASSLASPTQGHLVWSWRLAVQACDIAGAARWGEAIRIEFGYEPTMPIRLGSVPDVEGRLLPIYYPPFIWRLDHPYRPYVIGTWTYVLARPACVESPAG
jgi:hypothetical protein